MQSGTTGINTTRVYNPIKQAQDHDPHGRFVRQWLPALRQVPDTWLFEPWLMPHTMQAHLGVFVGNDMGRDAGSTLAEPVVDLAQATRETKQLLHSRRQTDEVKAAKKAVVDKHASRKNWGTRTGAGAGSTPSTRSNSNTGTRRTASRKATRASVDNTQAAKAQLGFDF